MLHLSPERLAALVDDVPTALEAEHLACCASCAEERLAHRRMVAAAAQERLRIGPPLTNWASLSTRLRSERRAEAWRARRRSLLGRAAAALVLVVGGVAAGRASAGAPLLPATLSVAGPGAGDTFVDDAASDTAAAAAFASTRDALRALEASQREYQRAVSYLAVHDTLAQGADAFQVYRTRLAALDDMAVRSREALYDAPDDPVINQYYLSTLGAREATLRQLGAALPDGARLRRF
jgi:hypothetical protein